MQDLDENSVTEAALAQMANTPDPRLKEIMDAAVRHLHAFARDVRLTPQEWLPGIQFLTAVGQACTPFRQEFILLADVLGISALVNAMHDKKARELGTQSSLLGPFYREGAPELPLGASIVAKPSIPEIVVYGRVTDNDGNADTQCARAGLADQRTRPVRPAGRERRGDDGPAGQLPRRCGRQLPFPHRAAARLLDPDGWARWARWCRRRTATASAPRISISLSVATDTANWSPRCILAMTSTLIPTRCSVCRVRWWSARRKIRTRRSLG